MADDTVNLVGSIDSQANPGSAGASQVAASVKRTSLSPEPTGGVTPASEQQSIIKTDDNVTFSRELMDEKKKAPGYGAPRPELREVGGENPSTVRMLETAKKASKGDKEATHQNVKNIMDLTREPFAQNFQERYKSENNGKEPSKDETNKAHNKEFLKSFTQERYGFGQLAGIEPGKIDPAFNDPLVHNMMISFPDKIDLKNPDGSQVKDVSINHMLSGVQFNGTTPDSDKSAIMKNTFGQLINSRLAESLKKTGVFGQEHKVEPGKSGIWAGSSEMLMKEFLEDPVKGMEKLLNNPSKYINDSKALKTKFLAPLLNLRQSEI